MIPPPITEDGAVSHEEHTDSERLDWLESQGGGELLQVEGNIMPAGTWVFVPSWSGGAEGDVDMGPGIRGAIDAAMHSSPTTGGR